MNGLSIEQIILFIGAMAMVVSVVTEALKKVTWLEKHVPTCLTVILLSMILTPASAAALWTYYGMAITWYMIFACFVAAFVVALVSMDGWERITDIAKKCLNKGR